MEIASIWLMSLSMIAITLFLTAAGFEQVMLQRMPESGVALSFMATSRFL